MSALIILGTILLILGIILFFVQKQQTSQVANLHQARSAKIAELQTLAQQIAAEMGGGSWQEYVKLSGIVRCDQPLVSELKQSPCVHYRMQVTHEYEERVTRRDQDGNSHEETERESEIVASNERSVRFQLEDDSGQCLTVNPQGAKIETIKVLDQFQPNQPAGGMISFGGFSLALGGNFGSRRTLGYHYREFILPIDEPVLMIGMVSDQTGSLMLQKPSETKQTFLISLKTEAELERSTQRNAQFSFYGMVGCVGIGVVLVVIGLFA